MVTQSPCLIPALRARMGDWWFYVTTMTFKDIVERVKRVKEIHETSSLKTWIQRELKESRTREIAEYLNSQPQRFFNAIVLGLFDGAPDWYPISVSTGHVQTDTELEDRTASAFGLIKLNGHEQIFAVDGQHRIEGIKMALGIEGGSKLNDEELAVIFVAHKKDEIGRQRTLMSGHIHSGASSHECELVRALDYDTPRLLDYSPYQVYRERASLGTWAPTQRDYDLCEHDY